MAHGSGTDAQVAVIGGGVVGAAVLYTLARRGVAAVLLEAEAELALGASGTNSGILHNGFDSVPGDLETELLLRAAELRETLLDRLSVPVIRCGALLRPQGDDDVAAVAGLAENAAANGVTVNLRDDGALEVPGESVSDPVAYTLALAGAATAGGAEVRTGSRVEGIEASERGLLLSTAGGERVSCEVAVNAAGLYSDEVARMVGDDSFEVYPRKGEFFVFDAPPSGPLERILLPVPTKRTKGVLVFPTVDGKVVAGPTAHDQQDKEDWSVRPEAADEVLPKATAIFPELEGATPIASYAGLRPAGRGVNYLIGPSAAEPRLIHAAAIRSTGFSASLGIAERMVALVARLGVRLEDDRELPAVDLPRGGGPWWQRTARAKVRG
ncbi:MAG: glycerol-3-phosphate dehydrogenase [Solirubrobacterales bacterium]|jgi:glycerol-3-phosphate dehydrogenase|nr:glycerol-3-phosphate dehydrogenase [Solirubrobacterales bacterium]